MELTISGNKLTGVRLRFVDPKDTSKALTFQNSGVFNIGDDDIYVLSDDLGGFEGKSLGFDVDQNAPSDPLEWVRSGLDIDLDKVITILIGFNIERGVSYGWHFDVNDNLMPKGVKIDLPDGNAVSAAETAAQTYLYDNNVVVEAANEESLSLFTITSENTINEKFQANEALVSSAIAVSQNVDKGGAVVLGKVELPLNTKSLNGTDIAKAETLNDLKGKYSVMKYFPNGDGVDLLTHYGDDLFNFENDGMVEFKKMIIVVDNEVKSGADFTSGKCGVKLEGNYLYVFDGEANKIAEDPIALQVKSSGGGSSGGCSAGFGLLGLLLAAGLAARKYKGINAR
jgi:hypothetical protein